MVCKQRHTICSVRKTLIETVDISFDFCIKRHQIGNHSIVPSLDLKSFHIFKSDKSDINQTRGTNPAISWRIVYHLCNYCTMNYEATIFHLILSYRESTLIPQLILWVASYCTCNGTAWRSVLNCVSSSLKCLMLHSVSFVSMKAMSSSTNLSSTRSNPTLPQFVCTIWSLPNRRVVVQTRNQNNSNAKDGC